jgi:crotonobetainyl-CoA:carnitine CoA-transferase CaiB-like acyl-CoA transferase
VAKQTGILCHELEYLAGFGSVHYSIGYPTKITFRCDFSSFGATSLLSNDVMLNHIKVLELASVLAGPSVGQFFAELGAEVIKVENSKTGGDVTRSWKSAGEQTDDRSAYFCSVNWGKKSIALDLSAESDQSIVRRLSRRADIVIVSYKPGDAEKLGVSYDQLKKENEKIIYGQITGYGSGDWRVGYDAVLQAEAGFMFMNGEPGGNSLKMPVALVDILAAHHLKEGLLLALLNRERSGKGSIVEVSLLQAAVASLANQASNLLVAGKVPQKQGSAHPNIAPYGDVFKTQDGKEVILAVGNDRQFKDLCFALGLADLSGDPFFKTNQLRVTHRSNLRIKLEDVIKKTTSHDLLLKLNALKVPAGLVQNMQEVMAMPQVQDIALQSGKIKGLRNFVATIMDDDLSYVSSHLSAPPHLGEHTIEILNSL